MPEKSVVFANRTLFMLILILSSVIAIGQASTGFIIIADTIIGILKLVKLLVGLLFLIVGLIFINGTISLCGLDSYINCNKHAHIELADNLEYINNNNLTSATLIILNYTLILTASLVIWFSTFLTSSIAVADVALITDLVRFGSVSIFINRFIEILTVLLHGIRNFALCSIKSINVLIVCAGALLELVSIGFRSISLGFRLIANISAGHVLSDIAIGIKFTLPDIFTYYKLAIIQCLLGIYEFGVACIQLLIFLALLIVFSELI